VVLFHLQLFVGDTEEYDGTNWTSSNNLNTARYCCSRIKSRNTNSSISSFGGQLPFTGATEEYNGATWTTVQS
jgi:cellulase/cellobiase CelA1